MDSWHYQLLREDSYAPRNLCPYMRKLIFVMCKMAIRGLFRAALTVFAALVAICPILLFANSFFDFLPAAWLKTDSDAIHIFMIFAITGIVAYICATVVLLFCGGVIVRDRIRESDWAKERAKKSITKPVKKKEPSILYHWWKAFHDKTCPPIDFVFED